MVCVVTLCVSAVCNVQAGRRAKKSPEEIAVAEGLAYPEFSQAYWETQVTKARGKILRGAVLSVTGLAVAAPTVVLAIKAADNPEKYLAYSAAVGIAALGMTFHGFFSVGFGVNQRERAIAFAAQYRTDPAAVDKNQERRIHVSDKKKSAGKMIVFGMALDVEAALMLANGIVLSVRDSRGELSGDVKIWPSYLIGGLLLAGGTTFAVLRGRTFLSLVNLGRADNAPQVSVLPLLYLDSNDGFGAFGLQSVVTF